MATTRRSRASPSAQPAVRQLTPFDRALELHVLRQAAADYASRHGEPGSIPYRHAWLRFSRKIRTIEDLRRLRAKANSAKRPPRSAPRAKAA